jgi:hypothetical protein
MITPTPPPEAARPTKETDAFMTLIDDSEIDLGLVEAKLSDFERQRDEAREDRDKALEKSKWARGVLDLMTASDDLVAAKGVPKALRELTAERDALRVALADLMKLRNTIEVMGEWSALDMNRSLYKRESEKVAAAMEQARKLIPNP